MMQPQGPYTTASEWIAWEKATAPHPCETIARCTGCGRGYITFREGARCLACAATVAIVAPGAPAATLKPREAE